MSLFYLTPASISYLAQFILALAIAVFLFQRLRNHRTTQLALLSGFFGLATIFVGLMFLDAALSPYPRLFAVYAENTVLALALVCLIQFAYRFPQKYAQRRWEAYAGLAVSLVYFLWEGGYMVYRYLSLLGQETVLFRPGSLDYANAAVLLWVPIAFLRQCIAADPRSVNWLQKLWKPQGKEARGARSFIFVFGILFVLGIINLLRIFALPTTFYNAAMSIGILVSLWLFATNYINFIPGGVSVQAKLSILTLTLFLALLGSVGWLIAPAYIETFRPNLTDHQTLRFTPTTAGSYNVNEVSFNFEADLGQKIQLQYSNANRNQKIEFRFPFYERMYNEVYVANSGVISIGAPFWPPNMQAGYANFPAIFPLMIELNPTVNTGEGQGVYIRNAPDRLIVTWYKLPALYKPETVFTFQAVLYTSGVFDITYNGLPLPFVFDPDATPSANPWVRGAVSGQGEPLHTNADDLLATAQAGKSPLIENYQLAFRRYLNSFMLPLGWIVIGGSLILLLVLPILLRFSVARPLEALSAGVRNMEAGDLNTTIPVQTEDEIGFLTSAFNSMASTLRGMVASLEDRVAARTSELATANERLRVQISEIESLQVELKKQAVRDPLTNAFNRRYLVETLERELARADRDNYPLSLVMMDVDHFKNLNDDFSHQTGDLVLKQLVQLIKRETRKGDAVCRYGGDEFIVLMPKTSQEDAVRRAEGWRIASARMKIACGDAAAVVTLSLGVVTYFNSNLDPDELLKLADQALYLAKASGRNCTAILGQKIPAQQ